MELHHSSFFILKVWCFIYWRILRLFHLFDRMTMRIMSLVDTTGHAVFVFFQAKAI